MLRLTSGNQAVGSIDPEIHPHRFYKQYIRKSKPVILRGAAKKYWTAFQAWSDVGLRELYPEVREWRAPTAG